MSIQDFLKSLSKHRPRTPPLAGCLRPTQPPKDIESIQPRAVADGTCLYHSSESGFEAEKPGARLPILRPHFFEPSSHSAKAKADVVDNPSLEFPAVTRTYTTRKKRLPEALADQQRSGSPIFSIQFSDLPFLLSGYDENHFQDAPALIQPAAAKDEEGPTTAPLPAAARRSKPWRRRRSHSKRHNNVQPVRDDEGVGLSRTRKRKRKGLNGLPLTSELPAHDYYEETTMHEPLRKKHRGASTNAPIRQNSIDLQDFKLPPKTPKQELPAVWAVGSGFDGINLQASSGTPSCRPPLRITRRLHRFTLLSQQSFRPLELATTSATEKASRATPASASAYPSIPGPQKNIKQPCSPHEEGSVHSHTRQLPQNTQRSGSPKRRMGNPPRPGDDVYERSPSTVLSAKSLSISKRVSQLYNHLTQFGSPSRGDGPVRPTAHQTHDRGARSTKLTKPSPIQTNKTLMMIPEPSTESVMCAQRHEHDLSSSQSGAQVVASTKRP
ncbi:MAG: hypothetical protein Q9217_003016 [Psora testacea]